jgi:hypothetical protein
MQIDTPVARELCYEAGMEDVRDAIYYLQLARVARLKAAATDDADLARRLREAAIMHERKARQIKAKEEAARGS